MQTVTGLSLLIKDTAENIDEFITVNPLHVVIK